MLARLLGPLVARGPVRRVLCGISLGAVIALQVVPLWPARETLSSDPMLDIRPGGDDRWLWRFRNWKHPQIENHRPLPKEQIGIGWWFAATGQDERLARLLHVWGEADPLAHGFGYGVGWRFREGPRERLARCLAVPCPLRQAVIRGFGTSLAERFIWDQEPAQLLKSVPVELRQAYLEGYGYGLGWRYWHNPLRFEPILEDFPADAQQHLRHGLKQRYDVLTDMEW